MERQKTVAVQTPEPVEKRWFKVGLLGVAAATALQLSGCVAQSELNQTGPATGPATGSALEVAQSPPGTFEPREAAAQPSTNPAPTPSTPPLKSQALVVQPPASEVVPADAKSAAATLTNTSLPVTIQSFTSLELLAQGGGGCGMSLRRAKAASSDGLILFSGLGEGPRLWMKLDEQWTSFERIEGSGETFYGQFAQQRFRNLAGTIQVMTEVELGAEGETESVAIATGRLVVTRNGVSQDIAVTGDAGC